MYFNNRCKAKPRYHIWTIGCQMNKAESERLGSCLEQHGYQKATTAEKAELIVLNSCVVRQSAENRVIGRLNALKTRKKSYPDLKLAVTGCLVNSTTDELKKRFPFVDYFFKPGEYPPWLEDPKHSQILSRHPSTTTFVPIIQGCNNFCSYCIVPYRRGRERSRPLEAITAEVKELVRRGTKEVILLGQNVDSYGQDLLEKPQLSDLLGELNTVDGLVRIRFLTNHPKDMSLGLINKIARLDKVCEEISLPVQSGSDDILKVMGRSYTAEHFRRLIEEIRSIVPGVGLSTDVIVGFPYETEEQFQKTFDLLSEIKFDVVHVAAYSMRPGTTAAERFPDNVPLAVKKERLRRVEKLQEEIAAEINARLLGKTIEVLVEGKRKGRWWGRSRSGKLIFFDSSCNCLGRLVKTEVEKTSPWALQGSIITRRTD
ncbi:MAG: MiaB/RimO family radical SAM methylthiotransferase [Dehalococcoidales bacterium]|nr:MiaB/RimO family radical SAM methylthiotransferase [Dehalococcoidales bacterium]